MKKLKLPKVKNVSQQNKALSMDEYLEFVMFNLKHAKGEAKKEKKLAFTVPFKI